MKKLGCMLMAVLMAVAVSGCSDKKEASENKETEKKVINSFWHGVGVGIGIGAAVVVLT